MTNKYEKGGNIMDELTVIDFKGHIGIDSREVAEMLDKQHAHLLRDISGYEDIIKFSENPKLDSLDFFIPNGYRAEGNNKVYPCYILTRKGCDMVANKMTGEKGVLFTAAYVTKFEEMEKAQAPKQIDSKFLYQIAEQLEEKEKQIALLTPAAEFGNAVGNSRASILVRDYVKVLAKDGVRIGQDEFFAWLYKKGYIYRTKEFKPQWVAYSQYTELGMGVFHMVERPFSTAEHGDIIKYTVKITGKGQKYFYDKLKVSMTTA